MELMETEIINLNEEALDEQEHWEPSETLTKPK